MTRDNESTLTITWGDYTELSQLFPNGVRWLECEYAHHWNDDNTAVTFFVSAPVAIEKMQTAHRSFAVNCTFADALRAAAQTSATDDSDLVTVTMTRDEFAAAFDILNIWVKGEGISRQNAEQHDMLSEGFTNTLASLWRRLLKSRYAK